jgi:hypothetical protein
MQSFNATWDIYGSVQNPKNLELNQFLLSYFLSCLHKLSSDRLEFQSVKRGLGALCMQKKSAENKMLNFFPQKNVFPF